MMQSYFISSAADVFFIGFKPTSSAPMDIIFTARLGGTSAGPWQSLNVSADVGDERRAVSENQRRILSSFSLSGAFLPRQVHGDAVLSPAGAPRGFMYGPEADAVIVGVRGAAAGVMTADCLPVMLWHRDRPLAAAVHAGWRGIVRGVIAAAVAALKKDWRTDQADLGAWIGPGIGPCCNEVSDDVAAQIAASSCPEVVTAAGDGSCRADLVNAAVWQLRSLGLRSSNIFAAGLCTVCNENLFFSFRRDGARTGRMAAIIAVR